MTIVQIIAGTILTALLLFGYFCFVAVLVMKAKDIKHLRALAKIRRRKAKAI